MTPVPPQELEKHWAFVESGLNALIAKTGEDWTPVHVKQAIYEVRAFLFVEDDGFAILQQCREDWTAKPYLHVWAFWMPNEAEERMKGLFGWLDEMAETAGVGFGNWKFGSTRMGWGAKRLKDEIEVERIIWRRKNGI